MFSPLFNPQNMITIIADDTTKFSKSVSYINNDSTSSSKGQLWSMFTKYMKIWNIDNVSFICLSLCKTYNIIIIQYFINSGVACLDVKPHTLIQITLTFERSVAASEFDIRLVSLFTFPVFWVSPKGLFFSV